MLLPFLSKLLPFITICNMQKKSVYLWASASIPSLGCSFTPIWQEQRLNSSSKYRNCLHISDNTFRWIKKQSKICAWTSRIFTQFEKSEFFKIRFFKIWRIDWNKNTTDSCQTRKKKKSNKQRIGNMTIFEEIYKWSISIIAILNENSKYRSEVILAWFYQNQTPGDTEVFNTNSSVVGIKRGKKVKHKNPNNYTRCKKTFIEAFDIATVKTKALSALC